MTTAQVADVLRRAGCVFAEAEAELLVAAPGPLDVLVARRVAGEPLEQVLGWAEFDGLRVRVVPGVSCRRRRSQLLVRLAAERLAAAGRRGGPCCGSGALGMALRRRVPGIELYAVGPRSGRGGVRPDQPAGCLRRRGGPVGRVTAPRDASQVNLANAPYVPSARIAWMPPEARDHEPLAALDGGHDGLEVHSRIAAEAASWLEPGGLLLIEVAPDQSARASELLTTAGLAVSVHTDDELDATVVTGVRPKGQAKREP